MSDKQKPLQSFKDYPVEAAIWPKEVELEGGRKKTFYHISLTNTYKDGDEYKTNHSIDGDDLLKAAHLLRLAHEHIRAIENAPRQS